MSAKATSSALRQGSYIRRSLVLLVLGAGVLLVVFMREQPEYPIHPAEDLLPHSDHEHVLVDTAQSINALEAVPEPIALLAEHLEDPESVDMQELETLVAESPWYFRVRAIDDYRLVLVSLIHYAELEWGGLDYDSRLLEYDLRSHEYVDHAEQDVSIGSFNQMIDVKRRAGVLYVSRNPMEISRFDCASAPCTYDRTKSFRNVGTVARPRAIAPVTDSTLAVFTSMPRTGGVPFDEHFEDVIKVFDDEQNMLKAFGSTYNGGRSGINYWFMRYAMLEYSEEAAQFALMLPLLPYLYTYDEEGELRASYQFDTEMGPVMEDTGREGYGRYNWFERNPRRTSYLLTEMDGFAVVARESIEWEDLEDQEATYRYDYHAIDLENEEAYHIGTDTYVGTQERLVFVTEAGLVLHDGEALYFIGP